MHTGTGRISKMLMYPMSLYESNESTCPILSNPKDILFFAAFFPQFIQITSDVGLSLGLLSIIWVAIDLGVLSFYILAIRRWLAPAHAHRLTTIAACFLLILGVYGVGYHFWLLAGH